MDAKTSSCERSRKRVKCTERMESSNVLIQSFFLHSGLFPDVLKNMQTDDLEQKKLVYLYLMNFAKTVCSLPLQSLRCAY
jgi:hypothetical protein